MSWVDKKDDHPSWLSEYCSYLSDHCPDLLDITVLKKWIMANTIEANIPIGYGLGSSGALTAAIYDIAKTSEGKGDMSNLSELQHKLGLMESFFHGKSSGFDPLISYLRSPILRKDDELHVLDAKAVKLPLHCYLLDSGAARSGKDMIAKFLENYETNKIQIDQLSTLNSKVIDMLISTSSLSDFYINIKTISALQHKAMPYMIIDDLKHYWQEGLKSDDYYLKICGAGGGGYYLVFSMKELSTIGSYKLQKVVN